MTTAARLGLLCGLEKEAIMRTAIRGLRSGARAVGKKMKGVLKGKGKGKGKLKGKKGKKGKGPKAVEAPPQQVGSDFPQKIDLPSGVPEGGPVVPGLAESLGHSISDLSYNISPDLQRLLIRLAGGPNSPTTARTLGFMAPAAGIGTMYGLSSRPEPSRAPTDLRAALMSGYVPPTFGY